MLFLKPKEVIFVQVKFVPLDKTERGVNALVLQVNKKMYNIVGEEFDVCHKFLENCVQHILKFVSISHLVGSEEFHIFVEYDKKNFGGRI